MQLLQVKDYHNNIAQEKLANSRHYVRSMFYFMLEDRQGYPIKDRVKGYVAFDNTRAIFGMNKEKAIARFDE